MEFSQPPAKLVVILGLPFLNSHPSDDVSPESLYGYADASLLEQRDDQSPTWTKDNMTLEAPDGLAGPLAGATFSKLGSWSWSSQSAGLFIQESHLVP